MLQINQIKMRVSYSNDELERKICSLLKILRDEMLEYHIERKSIDARKKPDIFYVLSVSVKVNNEAGVLNRINSSDISFFEPVEYSFSPKGTDILLNRPIVVGAGPAGLFAALYLSENGYKPIVLERGYDVDSRERDVSDFWNGGPLNPGSNVLFGEGGAGTFSDGKLNTLVKDKNGRNKEVLKRFVEFGADPSILYEAKPHVGTDVLKKIVKNIREHIKSLGGEFRFNAEVTDLLIDNDEIKGVVINGLIELRSDVVLLCIGHSARNTFEMLYKRGVPLEQKDFAVGFRIEHKQDLINNALYCDNEETLKKLPPASYKLTYKADNQRGVYSFCMCPGGYVVNASSEPGMLCVNGMSYSGRDGVNANSAIVVTVSKSDFESDHPLAGIEFQRKLEKKAFYVGNGAVPVERYGNFKSEVYDQLNLDDIDLNDYASVSPQIKGAYSYGKVSEILPRDLNETIVEGIEYFNRIIPGFSDSSALLSGIESRTSSPVRITRNDDFESITVSGLYPCGEGAGYAGGITSAAMDGMKAFEKIASKYAPIGDII